jgi:nucleoside-diphosphate-sugar epimerase
MASRYVVTGANGFIGAAICAALLARGDEVWAFDIAMGAELRALQAKFPALHLAPGEITEWQHVLLLLRDTQPSAVIHCAAIVGVVASVAAPHATMRVNVGGALNVLEAMRLLGIGRLVNLSTEEIYGHFRGDLITEDHPCLPLMPYGISKFAVEQLARDYRGRYGLECIHLRTCWVYGPGLPRARPPKTLIDAALARRPLHLPSGADFRVDHVYIDDLVAGALLAIDKPEHQYDAYHIASGAAPSLAEMVGIIKELFPAAELSVGPGAMRFDDRIEVVRKGALDINRARTELGYQPRFDLRAGLKDYVAVLAGESH